MNAQDAYDQLSAALRRHDRNAGLTEPAKYVTVEAESLGTILHFTKTMLDAIRDLRET